MENGVLRKSLELKSLQDLSVKASHLYYNKLPIRVASEKHCYKRRSWLLPEGETVAEIYRQIQRQKKSRPITSGQRIPQVLYYIDACLLLKNLFKISAEQFEESRRSELDNEIKKLFGAFERRVQLKEEKIDTLLGFYIHQHHMSEGATNLLTSLEAIQTSNKTTSKTSRQRVEECKQQRDKNIERLLAIEDELNAMAGAIKFQILGLVGFSRVIPGDVYEVGFKLESQKWKSKCKIIPQGQTWIDPEFCFKANMGHDFNVKMIELGNFGKSTLIGSVACSIQEFLLPLPQVFLLPINANGTIKIKLGVVWSALDGKDQKAFSNYKKSSLPAEVDFSKIPAVNLRGVFQNKFSSSRNASNMNGEALSRSFTSPSSTSPQRDKLFRVKSSSPRNSPGERRKNIKDEEKRKNSYERNRSSPLSRILHESTHSNSLANSLDSRRHSMENGSNVLIAPGPPSRALSANHLNDIDTRLYDNRVYNDVRSTTIPIKANLSEHSPRSWSGNNAKAEEKVSQPHTQTHSQSPKPVRTPPAVKPKPRQRQIPSLGPIIEETLYDEKAATPRMIDFCQIIIDMLADRQYIHVQGLVDKMRELKLSLEQLKIRQNKRPSVTDSIASALGSFSFLGDDEDQHKTADHVSESHSTPTVLILPRQWKQGHRALCHHMYMLYDLIAMYQPLRGVLREKENLLIHALVKQKFFVTELLILVSTPDEIDLHRVCKQYTGSGTLTNTWEVSASPELPLHCSTDAMLETFQALYQHIEIEDNNNGIGVNDANVKDAVCKKAVENLCETHLYTTDNKVISLLQFVDFFKTKIKTNVVMDFLKNTKREVLALGALRSTDDLVIISNLQQYHAIPVLASCINDLLLLIVGNKTSTKNAAINAMVKLHEGTSKKTLENLLLLSLEEKDFRLRIGACFMIGKCKIQSASEHLVDVYQSDDAVVRDAAIGALKELGVYIKT